MIARFRLPLLLGAGCYLTILGLLVWQSLVLSEQPPPQGAVLVASHASGPVLRLTEAPVVPAGIEGLLLPLGPDENRLPGNPQLWRELFRSQTGSQPVPANSFAGLQLLKPSEPLSTTALNRLTLGYPVVEVYRFLDHLYVLGTLGQMQIIDARQPLRPQLVESWSAPVRVFSLVGRGNHLYLLVMRTPKFFPELVIFDLAEPARPVELARHRLQRGAESLAMFDSLLGVFYGRISDSPKTLHLYSADPALLSVVRLPDLPAQQHLAGGSLWYVADPDGGLRIHVLEGETCRQQAYLPLPDRLTSMSLSGGRLYARGSLGRLYVINVSDPEAPEVVSRFDAPDTLVAPLLFLDDFVYLFSPRGTVYVYARGPGPGSRTDNEPLRADALLSLGAGSKLLAVGGLPDEDSLPSSLAGREILPVRSAGPVLAAESWGEALLLLSERRLQLARLNGAGGLEMLAELPVPTGLRWLVVGADRAYLGGEEQLLVVRRSPDGLLELTTALELPGVESWSAGVLQGNLLLAAGRQGLLRFDLGNPDRPEARSTWTLPHQYRPLIDLRRLAFNGNQIYAAAGSLGLLAGRIEADGQLELDGQIALDQPVFDLIVSGGLCLAATDRGVVCIDVRQPGFLQEIGTIPFAGLRALVTIPPWRWAGQSSDREWVVLPVPQILRADPALGESGGFALPSLPDSAGYRFNLFNHAGVTAQQGLFTLPKVPPGTVRQDAL